jgi:hypothetical protein
MTRSMAKESIPGPTLECIKADFIMENNTGKGCIDKLMVRKFTAYGKKERRVSFAKAMTSSRL